MQLQIPKIAGLRNGYIKVKNNFCDFYCKININIIKDRVIPGFYCIDIINDDEDNDAYEDDRGDYEDDYREPDYEDDDF